MKHIVYYLLLIFLCNVPESIKASLNDLPLEIFFNILNQLRPKKHASRDKIIKKKKIWYSTLKNVACTNELLKNNIVSYVQYLQKSLLNHYKQGKILKKTNNLIDAIYLKILNKYFNKKFNTETKHITIYTIKNIATSLLKDNNMPMISKKCDFSHMHQKNFFRSDNKHALFYAPSDENIKWLILNNKNKNLELINNKFNNYNFMFITKLFFTKTNLKNFFEINLPKLTLLYCNMCMFPTEVRCTQFEKLKKIICTQCSSKNEKNDFEKIHFDLKNMHLDKIEFNSLYYYTITFPELVKKMIVNQWQKAKIDQNCSIKTLELSCHDPSILDNVKNIPIGTLKLKNPSNLEKPFAGTIDLSRIIYSTTIIIKDNTGEIKLPPHVKNVYLAKPINILDFTNFNNIKTLEITANLTYKEGKFEKSDHITQKIKNLQNLEELTLGFYYSNAKFAYLSPLMLPKNLKKLTLNDCRQAVEIPQSLEALILKECSQQTKLWFFDDAKIEYVKLILPKDNLYHLIKQCQNLSITTVVLNNITHHVTLTFENYPALRRLKIKNSDKLKHITITNCPKLTEKNCVNDNKHRRVKFL